MTKIEKTLKELSDLRSFYLKIKSRAPTNLPDPAAKKRIDSAPLQSTPFPPKSKKAAPK